MEGVVGFVELFHALDALARPSEDDVSRFDRWLGKKRVLPDFLDEDAFAQPQEFR